MDSPHPTFKDFRSIQVVKMADVLRKWIITDLESILSNKEPFKWSTSARRVQIISVNEIYRNFSL